MSHPYTAGRIVGSLPPPPGQTANFVDPPNHDAEMIALHTTCLILITLFVGMRLYCRAVVLRQFGWDDAFCVAGWMLSVAYSAITLKIAMTLGLGRHLWDVPATQAIELGKVFTHSLNPQQKKASLKFDV
ncbi:hypothetical protein MMC28_005212 [Mycoblastus sanguinarius]|nr:hypothetical protein [Mycoblastus sanguinarius]